VDGVVRDDLLTAGEYSFHDIGEDHTVEVLFTEKSEDGKGDKSEDANKNYVSIKTETKGQGSISNSKNVKKGTEQVISWEPADGWKVGGVLIDGKNIESLPDDNKITIKDVSADHTVQVIFVPADGSEPGPAYTIQTDIVGGEGAITATGEALEDGKYVVTWNAEDGYEVVSIIVDGVERNDLLKDGSITFDSVDANHTIQVKLQPKSADNKAAENKGTNDKNSNSKKAAANKAVGGAAATGDNSPVMTYIILLMITGCIILLEVGKKVKRRHQ
jgi:hypothetical protein